MESLGRELAEVKAEVSRRSRSTQESNNRWPSVPAGALKLLLVELLKVSPGPQSDKDEMQYGTYRHVLSAVHPHWAVKAIQEILVLGKEVNPQHPWRPLPSDIIEHAAKLFRAERMRASGDNGYNPRTGRQGLKVSRELALMRRGAEANGMLDYCAAQIAETQLRQLEDRSPSGRGSTVDPIRK